MPQALHATVGSDIHRRTEDFRNLYKQVEIIRSANGFPVKFGSGVAAVQNVYTELAVSQLELAVT